MKCILILVLSAAASLQAAANDFTGTWKAVFTGPMGERPKMVAEMTFNLTMDGNRVTGMAHMSNWPGDAAISDGKVEGDHITFTVVGKLPWTATSRGVTTSGYPKLVFDGTRRGSTIELKVNWGSILTTGEQRSGRDLDMSAHKISD